MREQQIRAFGAGLMKLRFALGAAALLFVGVTGTPAHAVANLYEIDAFYQNSQPGTNNSITGSFTMDGNVGPASISNVDISVTLPTVGGPFSFTFDQVFNPVATWNAFGGTSPYLWFANSAFSAGDTLFRMGVKYDTNSNDGSYVIGLWGNSGNPHQSEISVIGVNNWQGIEGRVTREIAPVAPVPLGPATLPTMVLGLIGARFFYRRKSSGA